MALNLNDFSPNGNTLTNNGATENTSTSPFAQSTSVASFVAASSQNLSAVQSSTLKPTSNFVVEVWFKTSTDPAVAAVIVQNWFNNGTLLAGYQIDIEHGGKLRFWSGKNTGNSFGTDYVFVDSSNTYIDGSWYHAAGRWEGSNLILYVHNTSGTLLETISTAWANAPAYNASGTFRIGSGNNDGSTNVNFWNGQIDEVRVWGADRTLVQIGNSLLIELSGSESNLNAYYPFESLSSASASLSPSSSQSASASRSASASASSSASRSLSPSASLSQSASASSSASRSLSPSPSLSPSSSISPSPSSSVSASPSQGFTDYTRQESLTLPANDTDLSTVYTEQEVADVSNYDGTSVGQVGSQKYMIHQFKVFIGNITDDPTILCRAKSLLAPSLSPVYLQIYNRSISAWETIDRNDIVSANITFRLAADILDFTNYRDSQNLISCRIWQLAI